MARFPAGRPRDKILLNALPRPNSQAGIRGAVQLRRRQRSVCHAGIIPRRRCCRDVAAASGGDDLEVHASRIVLVRVRLAHESNDLLAQHVVAGRHADGDGHFPGDVRGAGLLLLAGIVA